MPVQKDKTQEEYLKSVGRHMARRRKFTYKRVDVSKLKCKITRILSEEEIAKEYKKTKKARHEKNFKKMQKFIDEINYMLMRANNYFSNFSLHEDMIIKELIIKEIIKYNRLPGEW